MKVNGLEDEDFDPKDWHVDLQTDYVTHFPTDIGFAVGFFPRDFESDALALEDFAAEPVHFPASGDIPGTAELKRLSHIAATLFGLIYLAWLDQRNQFTHQSNIDEDAA